MPENTLNQYTLSMANRDPSVFANPDVFDPTRKDCKGLQGTARDCKGLQDVCLGSVVPNAS